MLVADADAVEQGLGERGDIFAALAQRGNGEAEGGKPEGQVGQHQPLLGHLAQRGLRGGQHDRVPRRTVLQRLEYAQQQPLTGRGEQVNAIEIEEAGEGGGIGVAGQPFTRIAALETGRGEWRVGEEIAGQRLLAGARLAFNGGHLQMGRGPLRLHQQLAPGRADAGNLHGGRRFTVHKREAGDGGLGRELGGALHGSQQTSPNWPQLGLPGQQSVHRRNPEKHEPERGNLSGPVGHGLGLPFSQVRRKKSPRRHAPNLGHPAFRFSGSVWRVRRRRSGRRGCG